MQFFQTIVAASALVASAIAQSSNLYFPSVPESVNVGDSYSVTYAAAKPNNPATIILRQGDDPNNLATISTLTGSATGGSYEWSPSSSLVDAGNYALQIIQGDDVNYSGLIAVAGGAAKSSASASASATEGGDSYGSASTTAATEESTPSMTMMTMASSTAMASPTFTDLVLTTGVPMPSNMSSNGSNTQVASTMMSSILSAANGTVSTATLTATTSASGSGSTGGSDSSASSSGAPAESTGGADQIKSPAALVFGAFAAIAFLY